MSWQKPHLLFAANCFGYSGDRLIGHYNPRVDAMFTRPDAVSDEVAAIVAAHEAKGHRAVALQASSIRVERLMAGVIYSVIAELLTLANESGGRLGGKSMDDLHVVGLDAGDLPLTLELLSGSAEGGVRYLVDSIRHVHEGLTEFHRNIRPVYEIIATSWATRELYRLLPEAQAQRLEKAMVSDAARDTRASVDPTEFKELCDLFSRIESPHVRLGLGLHALDVGEWEERHTEFLVPWNDPDAPGVHVLVPGIHRGGPRRRLDRFAGLVEEALKWQESGDDVRGDILDRRLEDRSSFDRWTWELHGSAPLGLLSYDSQFPWRIMILLDFLLVSPASRHHPDCNDEFDDCMRVVYESMFQYVLDSDGARIRLNKPIIEAATGEDASKSMMRFALIKNDEVFGATEDNPLGIGPDWYKWALLFESLYLSLVTGQAIECPLSHSLAASCNDECPIRYHLRALKNRSELSVGAVCALADA